MHPYINLLSMLLHWTKRLQPNHACSWLGTWLKQSSNSGVSVEAIVASTVNSVVVSHVSKKTATGAYWWQPEKKIEDVNVVLNGAILLLKEVHFLESIALFGFHVATVVLRWAVSVAQYQNRGTSCLTTSFVAQQELPVAQYGSQPATICQHNYNLPYLPFISQCNSTYSIHVWLFYLHLP